MKAARLCPKVCGHERKHWEDWIFVFAEKHQLQVSDEVVLHVILTYYVPGYNSFRTD